ncbi:MAG: hypothetical protein HYV07_23740 [Deltaproteobacteria bacterium]|nr:hypothetical protein [Deltaproteobacteria bacterium]
MADTRLAELVVRLGLATDDRVRAAMLEQDRTQERLGVVLVRLRLVDPRALADALARAHNLSRIDAASVPVSPEARRFVQRDWAAAQGIVPVFIDGQILTAAVTDPTAAGPLDELSFRSGFRIRPLVVTETELPLLVQRVFADAPAVAVGTPSSPPPPRAHASVPPGRASQLPTASYAPHAEDALSPVQMLLNLAISQDQVAAEIQALFELCIERGIVSRREYYERLERLPF